MQQMNPYMDYQFAQDHNDAMLNDRNYYNNYPFDHDQGEYYDINDGYYEQDELVDHEINQGSVKEEISCCPMEMIHRRRHSLSYRPNMKKGVRKTDTSRIPKFRNPWDVHGELQPRRSKDVPLSYDEARFIREIWQDTRAQYEPSDGEIEEEFLFEEEYDDVEAEKRRNMLVKKGVNLVRYSRHYELPTISTIIKSSNPEQFRSRSFSPVGVHTRANDTSFKKAVCGPRAQASDLTRQQYDRGVREDFNFENRNGDSGMQYVHNRVGNSASQVNARGSIYRDNQFPGERDELSFRNNRYSETNQSEASRGCTQFMTPISSRHRNTALGIPSEFDNLNDSNNNLSISAASRRATSPDLLSPTKSTGRGPPPKIGILEPVETTEGLVSPVNKHKNSVINTPRMGSITSRSASSSILRGNRHDFDISGNISDNAPVISPTGKQTIVFHMIPDNENSNSKATIFADPDTQNIVTELHLKPGVDINVTSTPTGPAIEYEVSRGRNSKAQINFSTSTNSDSTLSIGDIPKIQTPSEFQEQQLSQSQSPHNSNFIGHNHGYLSHSRSQSRRRSTQEESAMRTHSNYQNNDSSSNFGGAKATNHNDDHFQQHNNSYSSANSHANQYMDSNERSDGHSKHLTNNSKILNNTLDEAGRIFSEIERDIQNQDRVALEQTRGASEHLGFEKGIPNESTKSYNEQHTISYQNESGLFEKDNGSLHSEKAEPVEVEESRHVIGPVIPKIHPNPFLPVKKTQKRSGFSGCILNTLTCSKVESAELKTFRALNPVEMISRDPEFF
ncbi:hypothetical protein OJ253_517 [Cryptosporidium canis]|uniref:Uncharacterized protein n=1 Tax=Cryptosporidium canis TaxID=195482 RepID=A0A9D5DN18_9CRYT|nr:hypothetical protein OJ253_517 [Cryptosporidium canis]